jgi:catechol 2,3-dioxygenase-like lactoylglutathione lyase family enzyme
MSSLSLVSLVVRDCDEAIAWYTAVLGFELVEDSPLETNAGKPKRWVVIRPVGGETGILLAQADGTTQLAAVGNQTADRVGFFLRVDDFAGCYARLQTAGVFLESPPRQMPYGTVAVFEDLYGNKWDLLGPA